MPLLSKLLVCLDLVSRPECLEAVNSNTALAALSDIGDLLLLLPEGADLAYFSQWVSKEPTAQPW